MTTTAIDPIASRLADLYVSSKSRYVVSVGEHIFIPKRSGKYVELTPSALVAHLAGTQTVSVYAGPQATKFVSFDVDMGGKETVRRVMHELEFVGFPHDHIYVSLSGGKGYHVEMFFEPLMDVAPLKALYEHVCREAGLDMRHVEFRPTCMQAIKLPLGIHQRTRQRCWFVDRDTLEPVEDMGYIFGIQRIGQRDAERTIMYAVGRQAFIDVRQPIAKQAGEQPAPDLPHGYPRLTGTGMTHNTMMTIAVHERCKGTRESEIVSKLSRWLYEQDPCFVTDSLDKTMRDIRELARWVWSDKFHVPARKDISLTDTLLALILQRRPRLQRLMLAAVVLYSQRYGCLRMGRVKLAELLGCHDRGIEKAVRALEREGIITTEQGKARTVAGEFMRPPTTYRLAEGAARVEVPGWLPATMSFGEDTAPGDVVRRIFEAAGPKERNKFFTAGERSLLAGAGEAPNNQADKASA